METLISAYGQFGVVGCICIGFFGLLIWVIKQNEKREDLLREDIKEVKRENQEREEKLYNVIEIISKDIPEIKEAVGNIEKKLYDINEKINKK